MNRRPPYFNWCLVHAKKGYLSRKTAKRAKRSLCEGSMSVYPCDAVPGTFHIGHTPKAVIKGKISRAEIMPRREVSGG